jgi:signal transduction histidine kinase
MNILINAKDVLGAGGRIDVTTATGAEGDVLVRIKDNGPGIPEDLRRKIFEVFYSTRGGGTGLGLPIAQRIMETHGGWIEVESEVGVGSTFILHIPRAPRPEGKPAPIVAHARP